jgi:hypothetical protein
MIHTHALAEPAKSGEYKGLFGWLTIGKTYTIKEGHALFVGEFSGTFFNDSGEGTFLHKSAVACPGSYEFNFDDKRGIASGFCIVTDRDGDKAFLQWNCQGDTVECPGTFTWIGGTGKYTGLSGKNKFNGVLVGSGEHGNSMGYSYWEGNWKLP